MCTNAIFVGLCVLLNEQVEDDLFFRESNLPCRSIGNVEARSIAKAAVAFKQARHEMLKITDFKNLRNIIFFLFFL